jgi:beta-lactamase superfamily II metal-dependent hydrolase
VISIELLPAAHGDSIWIEYGPEQQIRRVLIDGGPARAYEAGLRRRIDSAPEGERALELMVVTHIDADHIDGALIMLQEREALHVPIKEMWFNGWPQLPKTDRETFMPIQGEFLDSLITLDAALKENWNRRFGNLAVVVPASGPLPQIKLDGGATLTLLGPTAESLVRLRRRWSAAIRDFSPGDVDEAMRRLRERRDYRPPDAPAVFAAKQYGDDRTPPNGSSIAFVFEYGGISLLLAADSHARTLAESLKRLAEERSTTKLHFDAVKVPHHGSMGNISDDWLQWVDSDQWMISTNGAIFDHPDVATAQLIAAHCKKPKILCNYQSASTERLAQHADSARWATTFPEGKSLGPIGGLRLEWPTTATPRRPRKADAGGASGHPEGGQAKSTGKTRKSQGKS